MKTIIATTVLLLTASAALAQGYPGQRGYVVSPQSWAPQSAPQPYDGGSFAVITPGQPTAIITPLSPPPMRTDPCIYRLGGC